ncbi:MULTISPECIES: hypothetical protein [Sphingobacterium]|uniref:Uncharacterized protein n=1 Tax=Sphingobacterium tenebrionis TaxID=3111775 RepID=A0ABU8I4U7_9SPHI|nr:hypothetical protein [Sphingobacterium sp. CZ-2]QBR11471.1 hypothetical protein E3D81_04495 [Sphingobacterium sp. CZ-2]
MDYNRFRDQLDSATRREFDFEMIMSKLSFMGHDERFVYYESILTTGFTTYGRMDKSTKVVELDIIKTIRAQGYSSLKEYLYKFPSMVNYVLDGLNQGYLFIDRKGMKNE